MSHILKGLMGATIIASSFMVYDAAALQSKKDGDNQVSAVFGGMKLRNMGPALTSGRISDFAMDPRGWDRYFAATASGGIWLTENNGDTWKPIFDNYGSYSIGRIVLDPQDPNTIWVGTGENNSQRSVSYGDGVYKSIDGGKSFKNVGLKQSEHIGDIDVHPTNSDIVYVSAQGPLWNSGGERGVYKTTDGGQTWNPVLTVDEHTGANELVMHPDNPDMLVATTYQRQRKIWTLVNGGPGSGVHRSTDGGKTWTKVTSGLPSGTLGRIGLTQAPSHPNILYTIIEGDDRSEGIYRSDDFGVTWKKQSDYVSSSPQYYNELVVDPKNPDRVYTMDTYMKVSEDGGKTWTNLSARSKHVDEHALFIDPANTDHLITGNDGGIYESWDRGQNWRHIRNLSLTQFYKVHADNAEPFYNVYGGTQDNYSLGGPSGTKTVHGIANSDWTITWGGDGFETVVDPENPNIVYSQSQYGNLGRIDMTTGEKVYITPLPKPGELAYRWNWNAPVLISPHNNKRLYYAAEKIFRSDDQGNTWTAISGDLTKPEVDRNTLDVMGRVWSVDAVAKNSSTSIWHSIVTIAESPFQEGLLMIGTDDGLIQVSQDGGQTWRKTDLEDDVRGVPGLTLVQDIQASQHDKDTFYAVVDAHKYGDLKPYVLKTTNAGRSWSVISNNLPERGTAHTIVEDHVDPNLLFVGTEFGLFVSQNGGDSWTQMKGNFPVIAIRDLEIQARESDLVVGTFGRGIYILDDYSPLRTKASDVAAQEATLFPIKTADMYIQQSPYGFSRAGFQGDAYYSAENPMYGSVFSYYLNTSYSTAEQERQRAEAKRLKEGEDNPYPSWDALKAEAEEEKPALIFTIKNSKGEVVRRLSGPARKGFHRVAWDWRGEALAPIGGGRRDGFNRGADGALVAPGDYTVSMAKRVKGELVDLGQTRSFTVTRNEPGIFETPSYEEYAAFMQRVVEVNAAVQGANRATSEVNSRISAMKQAADRTPDASEDLAQAVRALEARMRDNAIIMQGDRLKASKAEQAMIGINRGTGTIMWAHGNSLAQISPDRAETLELVASGLTEYLNNLRAIESDLRALEDQMGTASPWTPGRIPKFQ